MFEHPIGDPTAPYKLPDRIKQLWPESPTPLKHCFTEAMQRKIGAKFRLTMYSHHVLADQKRAVMSVPWHELDYQESTPEQKEKYQAHCKAGRPPEDFVKDTTTELGSKDRVPWSQGMYAGMDCLYPHAWAELVYHFEALSCDELMSCCSRQQTTNMNESIHQKVALMLHKCKSHTTERIEFGTHSLMLSQNFGYLKSSLLNVFGWMTENTSKGLKAKDGFLVKARTPLATWRPNLSLTTS